MPIKWFDNRSWNTGAFLSIDRVQRLHLSQDALDLFGVAKGKSLSVYIGYDKEEKTIALVDVMKLQLSDTRPMKFDGQRYYASAKNFIEANQLSTEAHRYYYIGTDKETGAFLFQLEGFLQE